MVKTVLITDLDNTLFDWYEIWFRSFSAMLEVVVKQTGLNEADLKMEIRDVHRAHHTSEYAFLLEELPSLRKFASGRPVADVFAGAIEAFRTARTNSMVLFPSVAETLGHLKGKNCRIVAYTDSASYYSGYRMRKLGLDGAIEFLFSPQNHLLPDHLSPDEMRKHPLDHEDFQYTIHRPTPRKELKPNPVILHEIIASLGVDKKQCIYVGDSLGKDIAMAKDAGVDHAWAKYSQPQHRDEYILLREVSHWSKADIKREKEASLRDVQPDHILENLFSDILDVFDFS